MTTIIYRAKSPVSRGTTVDNADLGWDKEAVKMFAVPRYEPHYPWLEWRFLGRRDVAFHRIGVRTKLSEHIQYQPS